MSEDKNLIYSDLCEYGYQGFIQGFIYHCDEPLVEKYIVVIANLMGYKSKLYDNESKIKIFDNLKEAISFYEEELNIYVEKVEGGGK